MANLQISKDHHLIITTAPTADKINITNKKGEDILSLCETTDSNTEKIRPTTTLPDIIQFGNISNHKSYNDYNTNFNHLVKFPPDSDVEKFPYLRYAKINDHSWLDVFKKENLCAKGYRPAGQELMTGNFGDWWDPVPTFFRYDKTKHELLQSPDASTWTTVPGSTDKHVFTFAIWGRGGYGGNGDDKEHYGGGGAGTIFVRIWFNDDDTDTDYWVIKIGPIGPYLLSYYLFGVYSTLDLATQNGIPDVYCAWAENGGSGGKDKGGDGGTYALDIVASETAKKHCVAYGFNGDKGGADASTCDARSNLHTSIDKTSGSPYYCSHYAFTSSQPGEMTAHEVNKFRQHTGGTGGCSFFGDGGTGTSVSYHTNTEYTRATLPTGGDGQFGSGGGAGMRYWTNIAWGLGSTTGTAGGECGAAGYRIYY